MASRQSPSDSSQEMSSSGTESKDILSSQQSDQISSKDDLLDSQSKLENVGYDDVTKQTIRVQIIKRIGIIQIILGVLSIVVSIPLTVFGKAVGSGTWCSIFFLIMGGFEYTACQTNRSFRVIAVFGGCCIHFSLLMACIEGFELYIVMINRQLIVYSLILHLILEVIAISEMILTSVALCYFYAGRNNVKPTKKIKESTKDISTSRRVVKVLLGDQE